MQVGVDVTYINTNFGGRDLSGFGEIATFKKRPIFPFDPWAIVHGHQKTQLHRIGSKKSCKLGLMSNACTPILVGVASPVNAYYY